MNKKQFATKLMASILSTSILAPCATTFGVKSQNPNSEIVSTQKKKSKAQLKTQKKKNIPYGKIATWGAGLGATFYGVHLLWKHFPFGRTAQGAHNGQPVAPHVEPDNVPPPAGSPEIPVAPVAPVAAPVEDRSGWNELHHAAENEQNAAVLYNLEPAQKKACFEARDALGRTPLYIAFKYRTQFFLEYFHNEYNFEQLYRQSPQEMYNFFIFDVLCTAARLNDVHTLSNMSNVIQHVDFKYKKASTDQNDYSLLNMALAHGAQIAHERSLNLGITEPGYSLLDIALRHNARNAATYLMGQGVVFEMNNIFGNAAFTPEDKLAILNLLAENGYDFTGTDGHEPFDVRLVFGDAALTPENKLAFLNFLADHGYDFAGTNGHAPFDVRLVFGDATLTPENKLEILNFLADHGYDFAGTNGHAPFDVRLVFGDASLTIENKIAFLNSLARLGYSFTRMPSHSQPSLDLQQLIFGNTLLTPENKVDFLNSLARLGYSFTRMPSHSQPSFDLQQLIFGNDSLTPENKVNFLISLSRLGYNFAGTDNFTSFINLIFDDPNLTDENRLVILRSLRENGCNFGITSASSAHENLINVIKDQQHFRPILFKFYIEGCNALSYISDEGRAGIQRRLTARTRISGYQDLLNYFNQKCEDQPYVPNAQPANPAPTDSGRARIDNGDDSDSEEGDDDDDDDEDEDDDEDDDDDDDDDDEEEDDDDDKGKNNGHVLGYGPQL